MILKSITIQNIRSYTDAHIDFPSGSILLAGDIGSGKSTILQSIEFALFGLMRGDLDASSLLRTGTNKGRVTLRFNLEDNKIEITRNLVRGKQAITQDTGSLTINGSEEQLTATELRKRMIELLAYPLAVASKSPSLVYRYTVYTSQEQMKEILSQTPQERLQTLRAVFGIDTYQRTKENATLLLRSIKERIANLQGQLIGETQILQKIEDTKNDFAQLQIAHSNATKKHESAQKLLVSTQSQHNILQKTIISLSQISAKAQAIEQEIKDLTAQENLHKKRLELTQTQQNNLVKELADCGKISLDLTAEQQLLEDKKKYENQTQKIQHQLQETIARLATIDEKVAAIIESNKKREVLQAEFIQIQKQENNLLEQIKLQEDAKKELNSTNEQIMKTTAAQGATIIERDRLTAQINHTHENGICELCLQTVTPQQQQLSQEQKKQRLTQIMHTLKIAQEDLRELKQTKEQLTKTVEQMQQTSTQLAQLQGKKQAITQQLESTLASADTLLEHKHLIESEKKKLRDDAVQVGTQLTAIDTQLEIVRGQKEKSLRLMQYEQRITDLESQIVQQKSDLEALSQKISTKKEDFAKMQSQLSSFDSLKSQERQLSSEILKLREIEIESTDIVARSSALISATQKALEQLNLQASQLTTIKKQLENAQSQKQWLSTYFISLMDIMEQHVFTNVHADFSSHFQKWLEMLLDEQAISVTLDSTLSPQIMQNGYDVSVSQLSGGEKTSVALAYRLALNRVISDVFATIKTKNILILDEPTDGFSDEQLDRVRDVFSALPAGQLVIVSHEPKVETFVDHILRVQKENHLSQIITQH